MRCRQCRVCRNFDKVLKDAFEEKGDYSNYRALNKIANQNEGGLYAQIQNSLSPIPTDVCWHWWMLAATSDISVGEAIKRSPLVVSPADDSEYDAQFPNHPLTRVRQALRHIENSLTIAPALANAPPYRI